MHLALQKKHYHIARALVTLDPELIRVRGRGGITPLHYVAREKGEDEKELQVLLELMAEFLCACKSSIEDLTCWCETAVHVAIKNHNLEVFKVLFGWLKRVYLTEILNWKDENGNTVLHIAIFQKQSEESSSNPPAVSAVVTGNSSGIAVEKPHHAGNIILNGGKLYVFTALNSTIFVASVATIWITAIPLFPHTMKVYILMTFIGLADFATVMMEFPQPDAFAGVSIMGVNMYLLSVVLVLPMFLWVSYNRFQRGIDATGRRVGNVLKLKDQK